MLLHYGNDFNRNIDSSGVSLKIFKGEWVAIYGTSGGGKTSLLNIMGTIDKPTVRIVSYNSVIFRRAN